MPVDIHASSDDYDDIDPWEGIVTILSWLWETDRATALTTLADRAARQIPITKAREVGSLLGVLREVDAPEAITTLLQRDPGGQVCIQDSYGLGSLIEELQAIGSEDAIARIFARTSPPKVMIEYWRGTAPTIRRLNEAGSADIATRVVEGVVNLVSLLDSGGQQEFRDTLDSVFLETYRIDETTVELLRSAADPEEAAKMLQRYGREPDGSLSRAWTWNEILGRWHSRETG